MPTWRCAACPCRCRTTPNAWCAWPSRMVHITREHALHHKAEMKLRVSINRGPVVAAVIGKSKCIYDLWGGSVNLANRMESGARHHPGDALRLRGPEGQVRVRIAQHDRGQGHGRGR